MLYQMTLRDSVSARALSADICDSLTAVVQQLDLAFDHEWNRDVVFERRAVR